MEISDILNVKEQNASDDYTAIRVIASEAPVLLVEDLQGIVAARWFVDIIRHDFEQISYNGQINGTAGNFDGLIAQQMPNYWKQITNLQTRSFKENNCLWQPDSKHPLGKWFNEAAQRLLSFPPPEILDAILRRHGIEGSKEYAPVMKTDNDDFGILVHKLKMKTVNVCGVVRDNSIRNLWFNK